MQLGASWRRGDSFSFWLVRLSFHAVVFGLPAAFAGAGCLSGGGLVRDVRWCVSFGESRTRYCTPTVCFHRVKSDVPRTYSIWQLREKTLILFYHLEIEKRREQQGRRVGWFGSFASAPLRTRQIHIRHLLSVVPRKPSRQPVPSFVFSSPLTPLLSW